MRILSFKILAIRPNIKMVFNQPIKSHLYKKCIGDFEWEGIWEVKENFNKWHDRNWRVSRNRRKECDLHGIQRSTSIWAASGIITPQGSWIPRSDWDHSIVYGKKWNHLTIFLIHQIYELFQVNHTIFNYRFMFSQTNPFRRAV